MDKPAVTICVPTFNSAKTIERTINTILDQSYKNINIHVVDNASIDDTVDVVNDIGNPRIHVHTNPVHTHKAENNWNRCFEFANGEYMGIFHSDDEYLPDMIESQVEILKDNKDICAVFTGAELIDENSRLISCVLPVDEYKDKKLTARDVIITTLEHGNTLYTPSALFRTEVYKNILCPFRNDQFGYSADLDMWIRAANYSHIWVINRPLLRYRVSHVQGSAQIHKDRTAESAFFTTMDYHIPYYAPLPQSSIDKYELRRFQDKITCMKNCVHYMGMNFPRMVLWGIQEKLGRK